MKKKNIFSILVCALLVFSLTGCGVLNFLKPKTKGNTDSANADQTVSSDATSSSKEDSKADSTDDALATDEAKGDEEPAADMTDQELFDDFLKGHGEVHLDNYQPEKFYNYGEYMFAKGDSVTLDQLLGSYEQYYMQALTYTEPWRNISYTYIDAGDAGRKELVVECSFPGGCGAQFVMWAENGQLQMVYVMDSQERMYGTVANKYGLFTITNSHGYDYYDVQYKYLDENGEIHNVYTEFADYTFGQPTNMAEPILDWAKEFKDEGKLTDSVVLRSFSFDEFQPDFTPEEEEKYFTGMLYGNTDLFEYEVDESCVDDPEKVLDNFKPILFYDITDENIEKIVTMDYWNKNSGAGAFSDYSDEDAYNYLSQKAEWYFDLGIMDDDDSYDSVNFYDYDEENDVSTTIFFNLDKLIQSHFRAERY